MQWQHPTGKVPHTVILVALGPSKADFTRAFTAHHPFIDLTRPDVEIWTLNTGIRMFQHDLAFVMDDLRWYTDRFPLYGEILKNHNRPIITNKAYPEYPSAVSYPLGEVLQMCGPGAIYFRNSVPYVLAYAYFIGIKRIVLYGVDYDYPGARREHGRANVEFWLGYMTKAGIQVEIGPDSPLMDQRDKNDPMQSWFYGYLRQPIVEVTYQDVPTAQAEPVLQDSNKPVLEVAQVE